MVIDKNILSNYEKAGNIHIDICNYVKNNLLNIGRIKYYDVVNSIENLIIKNNCVCAFPVGLSVNNIIAHDTSYKNDKRELNIGDIVKIDIGISVDGCIVDSAFTSIIKDNMNNEINNNDEIYYPLLCATEDATEMAIKACGIDVYLNDVSSIIKEVIEGYEIEINNEIKQIKPIKLLAGHNIDIYKVHGNKLIYNSPHSSQSGKRMYEDEIYAIETFATTGNGNILQKGELTHFEFNELSKTQMKKIRKHQIGRILSERYFLPFNVRWLYDNYNINENEIINTISEFMNNKYIIALPPLVDIDNSMVSHSEHTIYIGENNKKIFSK